MTIYRRNKKVRYQRIKKYSHTKQGLSNRNKNIGSLYGSDNGILPDCVAFCTDGERNIVSNDNSINIGNYECIVTIIKYLPTCTLLLTYI